MNEFHFCPRLRKPTLLLLVTFGLARATAAVSPIAENPSSDEPVSMENMVVTGSYLPPAAIVSASPVDVVSTRQIQASGATDALQLLRRFDPVFQGKNNAGTETNLRGLGESYVAIRNLPTLVLVNGRRMVSSAGGSLINNNPSVDLNTIPLAAIERVEVLKDGASTLYGSDAIAGVVNFILKKDYKGFEVDGSYGFSTHGRDYTTRTVSLTGGVSTDRSSITVSAQYFKNDQLSSNQRAISSLTVPQTLALGSASPPPYYSGVYPGRVGVSLLAGSPLAIGTPGYNAAITSPPVKTDPNSPGMSLAQLTSAGYYLPIASTALSQSIGGSASLLNTTQFGIASVVPSDRREAILNGEHEFFGKHLVGFVDLLGARTVNDSSQLAPALITGVASNNLTIPANNPYNPFGVTIGVGGPPGAPPVLNRLIDLGNRYFSIETKTYRAVAGFRGEIDEHYNWETAFNYGRGDMSAKVFGGGNGAVMNQLLTPLIQNGSYVYNSAGKPLSAYVDAQGANVPVFNYFALPGYNDPKTIQALQTNLFQNGLSQLWSADAVFRAVLFELPAGKVGSAFGAEYRKEELSSSVDTLFSRGLALGYPSFNSFTGGSRSIKSLFGEVDVPLFSPSVHIPGFYALDVNLSGRHEDLGVSGTSTVPKIALRWQPIDQTLTFRSTYARGFIAPSIFNLFGPPTGANPVIIVPLGNGTGGAGGATGRVTPVQLVNAVELSNPTLSASKSESFTAGAVYSPREVKGLSVSLDYYHIVQDHAGDVDFTGAFADLNANGAASIYASGFTFADGTKLVSNAGNQVTSTNIGGIRIVKNPTGAVKTEGLDVGLNYHIPSFGASGSATIGINSTITFSYKFKAANGSPYYEYVRQYTSSTFGLGGDQGTIPGYQIKPYLVYELAGFSAALSAAYLPSVTDNGSLFGGQLPVNIATMNTQPYKVKSYTTADFSLTYELGKGHPTAVWYDGISISAGVNNFTDTKPPFIPTSVEDNTDKHAYDIVGRFVFFKVGKKF